MKITFKQAFISVFVKGESNHQAMGKVFLVFLPVIIAVAIYCLTHGISR